MSEYLSIGDSLVITLFSISMVFLVLVVISIFIALLKNLDGKEKTQTREETKIVTKSSPEILETEEDSIKNDEELVAVISAAVAASLGVSVPQINIKNIKRVNNDSPAWSRAGRQEQVYSKL